MTGPFFIFAVTLIVPIAAALFAPKLARMWLFILCIWIFILYAIVAYSIVATAVGQGLPPGGVLVMSSVCSLPLVILGIAIWRVWQRLPRVSN